MQTKTKGIDDSIESEYQLKYNKEDLITSEYTVKANVAFLFFQ